MKTKTREYPTVSSHDHVRCPDCGRRLTGEGRVYGQLSGAQWAKHCGAPCYGTAWYSYKPGSALDGVWGNYIPYTQEYTP